jgi:hypothetical protein
MLVVFIYCVLVWSWHYLVVLLVVGGVYLFIVDVVELLS